MRALPAVLLLCTLAGVTASGAAQERPWTPARGSDLRGAIMDGLRAGVRDVPGLDRPVVFQVHKLAVAGEWALATVTPLTPGGARIEEYERDLPCDREIIALLRRRGGTWQVVEKDVGPCDYAWREVFAENGYPMPLLLHWEQMEGSG